MKPIKYIKGNKDRAEDLKQVFCELGATNAEILNLDSDYLFYYIENKYVYTININNPLSQLLIKYGEEIKLPEKNELPKTWEEWVEMNPVVNGEFYIDPMSKICYQQYSERLRERDCINLSSSEDAEGLLALIKLKRLRDCYNDGWEPDWEDDTQPKFCIVSNLNKTNCVTFGNSNSFFSFKNAELRDEFLNNFRDLIEKAKMWL